MILPDNVYLVLKWITLVGIPALSSAYVGLASILGWPYADQVAKASVVVCTLIGTLIGISTAQYNKQQPPNEG